jgi:hypothetical protein
MAKKRLNVYHRRLLVGLATDKVRLTIKEQEAKRDSEKTS